ncbi:hypothetical protein NONI108955_20095 [Nocardia ninae]
MNHRLFVHFSMVTKIGLTRTLTRRTPTGGSRVGRWPNFRFSAGQRCHGRWSLFGKVWR